MNTGSSEATSPVISVILPVYNGGAYLTQSVQSVLNQTLQNFEFLVLDDCSTDDSFEYLQSISDKRMSLFKNASNKGLFYNLNFLITKSSSPYIKLWSQDDIMNPGCLASFVEFHNEHPQIGFSYSDRDFIDEHGKLKSNRGVDNTPSIISPRLHARIAYFTGSIAGNIANVCINRDALNEVGLFNEEMKFSADFDMWVRLAREHDTGFIKQKIIQLRDHPHQLSRKPGLYVNNIKEDFAIYKYLDSYVDAPVKQEGKILLRRYKLGFYYTIMIKAMLKGNLKVAFTYAKVLAGFDNFLLLTIAWLRSKFSKKPAPDFLNKQ